jgi:hypothetical protein
MIEEEFDDAVVKREDAVLDISRVRPGRKR